MPSSLFHVLPHVWQPTSFGFIKSGVSASANGLGKTPVSNTTKASLGVPSVIHQGNSVFEFRSRWVIARAQ